MTEILLLGTFHFMESNFDFYSKDIQNELQNLTQKLSLFCPDKIAIEGAISSQSAIDVSYQKFDLSDLKNFDKMRETTLGEISMFGNVYPITYNNESVQIGYRIGKMLNLGKIYGIDNDSILEMNIISKNLTNAITKIKNDIKKHENDSILDLYKYYNSVEWSKLNHNVYIKANAINSDDNYNGPTMVSKWYERNLKIFSNIQMLAVDSKKIFVLYGAGHLQILRDLINADENLKLVNVLDFI